MRNTGHSGTCPQSRPAAWTRLVHCSRGAGKNLRRRVAAEGGGGAGVGSRRVHASSGVVDKVYTKCLRKCGRGGKMRPRAAFRVQGSKFKVGSGWRSPLPNGRRMFFDNLRCLQRGSNPLVRAWLRGAMRPSAHEPMGSCHESCSSGAHLALKKRSSLARGVGGRDGRERSYEEHGRKKSSKMSAAAGRPRQF